VESCIANIGEDNYEFERRGFSPVATHGHFS